MTSNVLITVICDVISFIITAWLLFLNVRHGKKHDTLDRIFSGMLIIILILAVMDAVVAVFGFHVGYDTSITEMLFATGNETMTTVLCLVWMIYVNYRLYHSRDYIMRRFWLVTMPLIIILVLTMVSSVIFHGTGVLKAARITAVFFFALVALRFIYFLVSVFRLYQYKKQSGTMRYFKISFLVIPVIVTGLLGLFVDGAFRVTGYAVGFGLLYLTIYREQILTDPVTGFYSGRYSKRLIALSEKNDVSVGSFMCFKFSDAAALEGFAPKLAGLISQDAYVIRTQPDEVAVLTVVSEKSLVHMIIEDVRAVSGESGMEVCASYDLRQKDESAKEFLTRHFPL